MADVEDTQLVTKRGVKNQIRIPAKRHNAHVRPLLQCPPHAWKLSEPVYHFAQPQLNRKRAVRTSLKKVAANVCKIGNGPLAIRDIHFLKRAYAASTSAVLARTPP